MPELSYGEPSRLLCVGPRRWAGEEARKSGQRQAKKQKLPMIFLASWTKPSPGMAAIPQDTREKEGRPMLVPLRMGKPRESLLQTGPLLSDPPLREPFYQVDGARTNTPDFFDLPLESEKAGHKRESP